jgi:predicted O-methyltransferase YrrM
VLLRVRRFGGRTNMLNFPTASVVRKGDALANPFLADRFAERVFGDWTISAQAMNMLETEIGRRPPRRLLEFGSGLSTACLARYMLEHRQEEGPLVISVEEDAGFCAESRAILDELGLAGAARVHHVPLVRRTIEERSVSTYELPAELSDEVRKEQPDLVFIDGPGMSAGRFARWAVLHLVLPLLPGGFRFYLDDALSDASLEYARLWAELPGVRVEGIALVGHGLLVGEYAGAPQAAHRAP